MSDHPPCCGYSTKLEDYFLSRRQFLTRFGLGMGGLSLATLLDPSDLVGQTAGAQAPLSFNP